MNHDASDLLARCTRLSQEFHALSSAFREHLVSSREVLAIDSELRRRSLGLPSSYSKVAELAEVSEDELRSMKVARLDEAIAPVRDRIVAALAEAVSIWEAADQLVDDPEMARLAKSSTEAHLRILPHLVNPETRLRLGII